MIIQDFVQQKKRARKIVAANLSSEEIYIFNQLLEWRKEKGYSRDTADLLRQMMHFIINKEYLDGYDFVTPDEDYYQSLI
ncbi:MAG: hypothetical protein LC105_05455, partial [Chitinophagales bacterium]|nr:hypothetical protein [Chitinophagales bacterium]